MQQTSNVALRDQITNAEVATEVLNRHQQLQHLREFNAVFPIRPTPTTIKDETDQQKSSMKASDLNETVLSFMQTKCPVFVWCAGEIQDDDDDDDSLLCTEDEDEDENGKSTCVAVAAAATTTHYQICDECHDFMCAARYDEAFLKLDPIQSDRDIDIALRSFIPDLLLLHLLDNDTTTNNANEFNLDDFLLDK